MTKIAAIVPAYNEEKAIAFVVADINLLATDQNLNITVVVVNDCSTDNTENEVKEFISLNPATEIVPDCGFNNPSTALKVLVFPAPFGPRKPNISPAFTLKETLRTA